MENLKYTETGTYTGSTGIAMVGENPEDLDYVLEGTKGINGVIYKISLTGWKTNGSYTWKMVEC